MRQALRVLSLSLLLSCSHPVAPTAKEPLGTWAGNFSIPGSSLVSTLEQCGRERQRARILRSRSGASGHASPLRLAATMAALGAPSGLIRLRSTDSVDESFARLDAAAAGLVLRPTRLLLFGNPRAGTPLIAAAPTVALDLPLKVLVWESEDGAVWVGYNRPEYLVERHGVPTGLLANVRAVETLAAIAAGTT